MSAILKLFQSLKEVMNMEILLDTINIDEIKRYIDVIQLAGITSNPTIVKKEGKVDFFAHMKQIREIIGKNAKLHIQAVGETKDQFIQDAYTILDEVDKSVYVKIPATEEGLAAIKVLKQENVNVTATGVYTEFQAYLAIANGVDYIAPYYNRMRNMNIDAAELIRDVANQIEHEHSKSKILAASFHNVAEVNNAIRNGAQAVTMGPDILASGLGMPAISEAVKDFKIDWESVYGKGTSITTLSSQNNKIIK